MPGDPCASLCNSHHLTGQHKVVRGITFSGDRAKESPCRLFNSWSLSILIINLNKQTKKPHKNKTQRPHKSRQCNYYQREGRLEKKKVKKASMEQLSTLIAQAKAQDFLLQGKFIHYFVSHFPLPANSRVILKALQWWKAQKRRKQGWVHQPREVSENRYLLCSLGSIDE